HRRVLPARRRERNRGRRLLRRYPVHRLHHPRGDHAADGADRPGQRGHRPERAGPAVRVRGQRVVLERGRLRRHVVRQHAGVDRRRHQHEHPARRERHRTRRRTDRVFDRVPRPPVVAVGPRLPGPHSRAADTVRVRDGGVVARPGFHVAVERRHDDVGGHLSRRGLRAARNVDHEDLLGRRDRGGDADGRRELHHADQRSRYSAGERVDRHERGRDWRPDFDDLVHGGHAGPVLGRDPAERDDPGEAVPGEQRERHGGEPRPERGGNQAFRHERVRAYRSARIDHAVVERDERAGDHGRDFLMAAPAWIAATSGQPPRAAHVDQYLVSHAATYLYAGTQQGGQTTLGSGSAATNGLFLAQSFTAGSNFSLGRAVLYLALTGLPATTTVSIQTSTGSAPTGTALVSTTLPPAMVPASAATVSVPLPCSLASGTAYWIVVAVAGDASDFYAWSKSNQVTGASTSTNGTSWT